MSDTLKTATLEAGKLCDIAPTLLDLAGIEQPSAMTGHSLVHKMCIRDRMYLFT